jgi:hypothetical protein
MAGNSAESMVFRRTVLAGLLCLLAFAFAVEAKTAWYGPATGFGSDVRAAKALPVNTPKAARHREPGHDPAPAAVLFAVLAAFSASWPAVSDSRLLYHSARARSPLSIASCLIPSVFFRPPPVMIRLPSGSSWRESRSGVIRLAHRGPDSSEQRLSLHGKAFL